MYGALSYLSYFWDLGFAEAKRWGGYFKVTIWSGIARHKHGRGGTILMGKEGGATM